jgi:2'-hydroxyisoflavone reductase
LLILGGTNYVGPALVRAARARGHHLTLFNRGITRPTLFHDVERRRGDRFPERDAGLSTLQSGEWDIVVDIPAYYPRHVAATANMLAPRARRYIIVSSIAAYSDWSLLGMTESSPTHRPAGSEVIQEQYPLAAGGRRYGARKVACEQAVAAAFGQRWASVRATGIIGAGIEDDDPNKFFWPARLALGKPILAPGDGSQKLQSIDVRDLAEFILLIAETDQMGVFNAIGPERPFTTSEYVDIAREVTGGRAPVVWSGRDLGEMPMYNDTPAFAAFDPRKARAAGLTYRSLRDSIQSNWDWFRRNYPDGFDFAGAGFGLTASAEAEGLKRSRAEGRWPAV